MNFRDEGGEGGGNGDAPGKGRGSGGLRAEREMGAEHSRAGKVTRLNRQETEKETDVMETKVQWFA